MLKELIMASAALLSINMMYADGLGLNFTNASGDTITPHCADTVNNRSLPPIPIKAAPAGSKPTTLTWAKLNMFKVMGIIENYGDPISCTFTGASGTTAATLKLDSATTGEISNVSPGAYKTTVSPEVPTKAQSSIDVTINKNTAITAL